jgi:hypothetical protein
VNRDQYILECQAEENRRWLNPQARQIAHRYQDYIGIRYIALGYHKDYLERLRAGYFEPIPLAWSTNPRNPLTAPSSDKNYDDEGGAALSSFLVI